VSASAPPPPPIRLAVLDMAGTTVRDDGLVTGAFADALAAVGIAPDDPGNPARLEYVMTTMGQSKIDVFTHLLGDPALAADALVAFDASVASRVEAGAVTPLPGAADAMAELRAHGVAVCLTTGFTADTQQRIISQLGWDARWQWRETPRATCGAATTPVPASWRACSPVPTTPPSWPPPPTPTCSTRWRRCPRSCA
jgi:phosphoglycolate phosphatase-like HAD superfamily hydrolase